MAWETALDRLILNQIHLAEKSEARPQHVRDQVLALWQLEATRPSSAFHLGYARTLLGVELPEPDKEPESRWYTFGRLRGHDRRGERSWAADLLQHPGAMLQLLADPAIATQCLPLVMRTLFWCGDLNLAVKAIEYLCADEALTNTEMLVDAALTDLLTRLENRIDRDDEESTASILEKCMAQEAFDRLPADVRARYHRALGRRMLANSEFAHALQQLEAGRDLADNQPRLRSSIDALGGLGELRLHDLHELDPRAERPERDAALLWLEHVEGDLDNCAPEALFVRGILAYEVGDYETAVRCLDQTLRGTRRLEGRDGQLIDRSRFFLAAALLANGDRNESSRALRLMEQALDSVQPDLESFYPVHEALKERDHKLALKFLDSVDVGRGTSADQILFVALEYLSLGEAQPASVAAQRVLDIAVNLDQRIEAMRVLLNAHNMRGDRGAAHGVFGEIRDLLVQRGAFTELETLLKNEEFVGQALDHLEIKCELASLYEEMDDRDEDKAYLKSSIARSLRARKDEESLQQAYAILQEVAIDFPDLVQEELGNLKKLMELSNARPTDPESGPGLAEAAARHIGHRPVILVVGGNERQRRHHPRFEKLAEEWGFAGEWLMANYTSPQKLVNTVGERLKSGIDLLVLLHWNRHETTEPALQLARTHGVLARTVHYVGFTSLQCCLADLLGKLARSKARAVAKR